MKKLNNSKLGLFLLAVISLIAGLHLLISPKTVNPFIIRGVGFIWVMEGVVYAMDLWLKIKQKKWDT